MHRLEYKQLDKLRTFLLGVPFVALTATATEKYVPLLLLVNFTLIWLIFNMPSDSNYASHFLLNFSNCLFSQVCT